MRPRLTALTVVVALAGAVGAATALADGDPASDYLISQKVFFPFDPRLSTTQKAELQALVEAANKGGYTIRVAIISSPNDMGTETSLYGKPRAYARFLGAELNYVYNDRLLVVMPGGFGFNDPRHPLAPTYAALRPITIKPGTIGLLNAAQSAVHELAAKNGVRLSAPPPVAAPEGNTTRNRVIIATVALLGILLSIVVLLILRRRSP